jgi:nicotinamidase-related amidase
MTPLEHLRAAMADVDAYYKKQGIFQGKFGFGKRPALIVIDMAHGWTDPAYAGGSARLDPAIAAIQQLLVPARAKKMPIFFTTSPYTDKPAFKSAADFSPNFRKWDERACMIDERVKPLPGEHIIYKDYASGFAGTPLAGRLMEHGIDTLLITGCSTSACVRATATDAKTYHLKPIIIREGVQDRSEICHEFTLFDIQARFADVVSLEDALKYMRS